MADIRLLHTSDWHLGQKLMGRSREEEHKAFLDWLLLTIEQKKVDVLLVCGDIFDTSTPPNYALKLYYDFLTKLLSTSCNDIVITAGNHDSVATLQAPKELLKKLNTHIVTSADENEDEIIKIYKQRHLKAIICAVPFLRDYVVRKSIGGEGFDEVQNALTNGIKQHYAKVYERAKKLKKEKNIPIIATAHLSILNTKRSESEREIYIGNSLAINGDFLAKYFDYVALGHLHINQKVSKEHVRYSGSPIPLSFSEGNLKKVNLIEFNSNKADIQSIKIPLYRELLTIKGNLFEILTQLEKLPVSNRWIEILLKSDNKFVENETIMQKAKELKHTVVALKIEKQEQTKNRFKPDSLHLKELKPLDVFKYRLLNEELDEQTENSLISKFNEILNRVRK